MNDMARWLLITGLALMMTGAVMLLTKCTGSGRLPGDIIIRRGNVTFYAPLGTCVLLSLVLSLILLIINQRNP